MIDLLPLVQQAEEGNEANGTYATPPEPTALPSSPHRSRSAEKSLLSKYKGFVASRRNRKTDSSTEEAATLRGSGNSDELDTFSPLGSGRTSGDKVDEPTASGRPAASPAKEPASNKLMGKYRSIINKRRGTKSGDALDDQQGPLAQGLSHDAALDDFFAGVSEAKALIHEITERQASISATRNSCRTMIKSSEVQATQSEIRDEIDEVTRLCKAVKMRLDELDTINAQMLADDVEEVPETASFQMRLSVMAGLNSRLQEVTRAWQNMQVEWHEQDREEVSRQLYTVTGQNFENDEVDRLIDDGGSEAIYRQALASVSGATVHQLMGDVQARHDQMRQLEASLLELHQVFLDMSILANDQGDMINNIDHWVSDTRGAMQESLKVLQDAKRSRRKAAQTKAITFVSGVGLIAGGAGLTASGVGAVAGVPMMIAGVAAVGGSAIGGIR